MTSSRISAVVRDRIRHQAGDRCGYCLSPQHLVLGWLEIEHINPRAVDGQDDEENLWLACRFCNNFKAAQTGFIDPEAGHWVPLFNPRQQSWNDNFRWSPEGTRVIGVTPCGRATVMGTVPPTFWLGVCEIRGSIAAPAGWGVLDSASNARVISLIGRDSSTTCAFAVKFQATQQ